MFLDDDRPAVCQSNDTRVVNPDVIAEAPVVSSNLNTVQADASQEQSARAPGEGMTSARRSSSTSPADETGVIAVKTRVTGENDIYAYFQELDAERSVPPAVFMCPDAFFHAQLMICPQYSIGLIKFALLVIANQWRGALARVTECVMRQ